MRVINIQGRKKTGKTTTVTNIIAELCRRGYSVGSIKGIHIEGFTMDVEGEDTGKHKNAGADPVTARCHDETNIMFQSRMDLREILRHYDNDWVVIESHVDLRCPNIVTGRTAVYDGQGKDVSLEEQVNDLTICCSGVVSNDLSEYKGLPVINSVTDIEALVDLIEAKTGPYTGTGEICVEAPYAEEDLSLLESSKFLRIDAEGNVSEQTDQMLTENTLDIIVDGIFRDSIPCTPQNLTQLALGWVLYEGYIRSADDIESVAVSREGTEARVERRAYAKAWGKNHVSLQRLKPIEWKKEWIFSLAEEFEQNLPLREQTMAAHNCRLARIDGNGDVEILFKCEDIGRHSAIDKVVGWGLQEGIDMSQCILFTSGRISLAMTKKVVRAGIPVMAGKGTISKRAVQLAECYGLTMIGYAKKDSISVFFDPKR